MALDYYSNIERHASRRIAGPAVPLEPVEVTVRAVFFTDQEANDFEASVRELLETA